MKLATAPANNQGGTTRIAGNYVLTLGPASLESRSLVSTPQELV